MALGNDALVAFLLRCTTSRKTFRKTTCSTFRSVPFSGRARRPRLKCSLTPPPLSLAQLFTEYGRLALEEVYLKPFQVPPALSFARLRFAALLLWSSH